MASSAGVSGIAGLERWIYPGPNTDRGFAHPLLQCPPRPSYPVRGGAKLCRFLTECRAASRNDRASMHWALVWSEAR